MGILSKDALLGASDLIEREVDLPALNGSVRVRSLPAAYSNNAITEALETTLDERGRQTARVNTSKLEELKVLHGLVDPKLSTPEEAHQFATQCGPSWTLIVNAIDEISGIDAKAAEKVEATFQGSGTAEGGASGVHAASVGDDGSDQPGAAGDETAHVAGADQ